MEFVDEQPMLLQFPSRTYFPGLCKGDFRIGTKRANTKIGALSGLDVDFFRLHQRATAGDLSPNLSSTNKARMRPQTCRSREVPTQYQLSSVSKCLP
jgi:hypothetical protein